MELLMSKIINLLKVFIKTIFFFKCLQSFNAFILDRSFFHIITKNHYPERYTFVHLYCEQS
jgi:hypothetical protein